MTTVTKIQKLRSVVKFRDKNSHKSRMHQFFINELNSKKLRVTLLPHKDNLCANLKKFLNRLYALLISCTALTLLVGQHKRHMACKNWVAECWHGYLFGAQCRFAYDPADTTATHCLPDKVQKAVKRMWVCVCEHACMCGCPFNTPATIPEASEALTNAYICADTYGIVSSSGQPDGRLFVLHEDL